MPFQIPKLFRLAAGGPEAKGRVKVILSLVAFAITVGFILYTQQLVDELIRREQSIVNFYAKIYSHYSNFTTDVDDLVFLIDEITPTLTFPYIMTYENNDPIEPFEDWTLNIEIDTSMTLEEQREFMSDYVTKMSGDYEPILVKDQEGEVIHKIFYTHSALIDKLSMFPFVAIITITAFVMVGYFAFSSIRRSEESRVWVGMAKEAAHQLGTPLSSLLAWMEIIRHGKQEPELIEQTVSEMENDINRLNTIATRFSKIGSTPEKKDVNISVLLENTCNYFEKRMPHLGKKIEIIKELQPNVDAKINEELFAWVIENLLKNAAEAIEDKIGEVHVNVRKLTSGKVIINIKDSGKGMTQQMRKRVFYPGFTTKRRGWGLGLSLSKRIVEEYHEGRIFIKDTAPGKGTSFQIELADPNSK
ncbi:MAG: sensor histidine kinase [Candidatus Kapaibacterium sp.]